jgi:hypothetical protein
VTNDPRNPLGLVWEELVGKSLLVGITTQDPRGNVLGQKQVHGRITAADPAHGLVIELAGANAGKPFTLPPDLRSLKPARPGEYRLRSTGEVIRDPDFLATWIVERPDG